MESIGRKIVAGILVAAGVVAMVTVAKSIRQDIPAISIVEFEMLAAEVEALKARVDGTDTRVNAHQEQFTGNIINMAIRIESIALADVRAKNMTDQQLAILLRTDRAEEAKQELQRRAK